jgi:hypothetical protein
MHRIWIWHPLNCLHLASCGHVIVCISPYKQHMK